MTERKKGLAVRVSEICENDEFDYQLGGDGAAKIIHKPPKRGRGRVIGAYCDAVLPNGKTYLEVMPLDALEAFRKTFPEQGLAPKGPWLRDYGAMARQAVVLRASRHLLVEPNQLWVKRVHATT